MEDNAPVLSTSCPHVVEEEAFVNEWGVLK